MLINKTHQLLVLVMCLHVIIACHKLESSLLILVSLGKYKVLTRINFFMKFMKDFRKC